MAESESTLRQCVRAATSAAAIMACENAARGTLEARVDKLTEVIRGRLTTKERLVLDANVAAWEAFAAEEKRLITLLFAKRRDSLGGQLKAGAVNQLLEQRIAQLRAYLHSLPE